MCLELFKYTIFDVFMVLMIWIVVFWVMTPYGLEVVTSVSEETAVFTFIVTYYLETRGNGLESCTLWLYLCPVLKIRIIPLFRDRVGCCPEAKE
jgi:hypothetical protein